MILYKYLNSIWLEIRWGRWVTFRNGAERKRRPLFVLGCREP